MRNNIDENERGFREKKRAYILVISGDFPSLEEGGLGMEFELWTSQITVEFAFLTLSYPAAILSLWKGFQAIELQFLFTFGTKIFEILFMKEKFAKTIFPFGNPTIQKENN